MNFDNRSMALNDEATLMVLDRKLGDEMNRMFLDDVRHAEEITVESFVRAHGFNGLRNEAPIG